MNGLILCLLIPLPLQANSETVASKAMEQAPSAITAEDWLAIRRLHEEQQLEAVSTEEGFRAFNPTQSWNVRFDSRGILVEPLRRIGPGDWSSSTTDTVRIRIVYLRLGVRRRMVLA